jgi:predicted regulator of Ras-like GTPase activity (Roadblock/LC7/MglB family)
MKNILKNISILRGVHHVCICQQGKAPISNFPDKLNDSMVLSYDLIDQIFSALKAIEKSHNEIYFSIGDKFLVAYSMNESCIVLLLTEKKINFPLLNMGIKTAKMKIQRVLKEDQQLEIISVAPQQQIEKNLTINSELKSLLDQLSAVLREYLGPATLFVFEDGVKKWSKTYVQSRENLPYLIEILKKGLDPKIEQEEFIQQAGRAIGLK